MGLDILLFRDEKGVELVKKSQKARYASEDEAQAIIDIDAEWKKAVYAVSEARRQSNELQKQIGLFFKKVGKGELTKDEATAKSKETKEKRAAIVANIPKLEALAKELDQKRLHMLNVIGNIVHASVPIENDEEFNRVEKKWGECRDGKDLLRYDQILHMLGAVDMERGSKVAGSRAYFLTGVGVRLNLALIQYGLDFLTREELGDDKYTPISTPFFMVQEAMAKTAQLEQFDEELYTVVEKSRGSAAAAAAAAAAKDQGEASSAADSKNEKEEGGKVKESKYLIATSEQPLSALHMDEWLEEKSLPIRYAGQSTCFRKEAGSTGRDVRGIFRVHQFDKIEQFCITKPEDSWKEHEKMMANAEKFYQSLGLAYHVVAIVSGKLNKAASKKLDLEAWFPSQNTYRELVSCSNCTDYQSRALLIRCGHKKKGEKAKFVHMLNSTLVATTRTICCLVENYQKDGGVEVPEVLRKYMGGLEFMPFVKEAPKEEDEATKKPASAGSNKKEKKGKK